MGQKYSPSKRDQLAILMSSGHTAASAARDLGLVERTCQNWARNADFRALVAQHRASAIEAALGRLTSQASNAATVVAMLMIKSKNEAIQLSAARTVLEQLIHIGSHANLMSEMAEMRKQHAELEAKLNAIAPRAD